jgi:hypothetical protein
MMRIPGRFAPSWTSTTGIPPASTPGMPPPLECSAPSDELPVFMRMHFCLLSRAANVRARAYAYGHVCVRARVRRKYLFVLLNKVETD